MVKMSLKQVTELNAIIPVLPKFPGKQAMTIALFKQKVAEDVKAFIEARNTLFMEENLTQKDNQWVIPDDKKKELEKKLDEMLSPMIEIGITPISSKVLDSINIEPELLFFLLPIITEQE